MSNTTWNGSASTDWATGANWSTGSVPTTSAHVVIPDTSSINNCVLDQNRTIGSLTIQANGTIVGGGFKLFIQSEGDASGGTEGFAVNNDGIISGNLDLEINTPATTTCDFNGTSGNFQNVKLNHASVDATFHTDTTFDGTLTIAAGTLKPQGGSTIAVAGHTSVTGTFGVASGSGAHSFGSVIINSGGTFIATSGTTTVTSENASHAFRCSGGGTYTNNDGTLEIQTAAQTRLKMNGTGNVHNLTVNHASCQLHMESDSSTTVEGDLTITAGIVNTNTEGGASRDLTVRGGIKNTGTLTANASTIIITGEIAGFAFDQMGTFNAGTSTIQIGDGSTSTVGSSTHFKSNNCHNLIINQHIDAPNGNVAWRAYTGTEVTIGGNLTITRGRFYRNTSTQDLTVTGDVDIASVGKLGTSSASGSNTFGSIVIAGTYQATSGTTTITNEKSGHAWKNNGGTFTHNNGKVLIDFDTGNLANSTEVKENTFYDLEVKLDDAAYELRIEDHSSTNAMDILNNLTVTKGIFDTMTKSDTLTIHGQTIIESDGVFTQADHDTNKIIHNGIVRNSGTYKINDGTTVKMNAGIRNLGTITVA